MTPSIDRGPAVTILVDGQAVVAYEGETVAAALLAAGQRTLRWTAGSGEPRGY
ncbi:MAG TPA: 2Fe-2S iron-sulfur cluster-binding protein, partial [Candidatus Binatia bacterium]|nr:2Fe-2S iron-sulfur cluster-binding protein [Candidatus Binatia bacterium]